MNVSKLFLAILDVFFFYRFEDFGPILKRFRPILTISWPIFDVFLELFLTIYGLFLWRFLFANFDDIGPVLTFFEPKYDVFRLYLLFFTKIVFCLASKKSELSQVWPLQNRNWLKYGQCKIRIGANKNRNWQLKIGIGSILTNVISKWMHAWQVIKLTWSNAWISSDEELQWGVLSPDSNLGTYSAFEVAPNFNVKFQIFSTRISFLIFFQKDAFDT